MAPLVTTNTYNFSPSAGQITLNAFQRIGVRQTEITPEQMATALMEMNLLLGKMSNLQPNLWAVDLQTLPLLQGVPTYSVPAETVMILDAFLTYGIGTQSQFDRILWPISRTDYASYPNKNTQAPPTVFWFDRLISPTITLWPVPDSGTLYLLQYYRVRQNQDATFANGANIEVPYRWLDAFTAGLAYRLARIYRPELEAIRKADAQEAWDNAATQDTENVPLYVIPGLSGYFR